jgi:translocator protein
MLKRTVLFLLLNFAALALGGLFTGAGVASDWYTSLNQAPWTPPGWVFGVAWTTIMICFTFYMAHAFESVRAPKKLVMLFAIQWILNVSWNPIFFHFHHVSLGLVTITLLTVATGYMLFRYSAQMRMLSLLLAPYVIWLCIATSLNAYIVFNN